jgi:hypothetical protein
MDEKVSILTRTVFVGSLVFANGRLIVRDEPKRREIID